MLKHIILVFFVLLLMAGCESKSEKRTDAPEAAQQVHLATTLALNEPIEATLVETATAALPAWRKSKEEKPVLVLFSNNPFLQAIPPELQIEAARLTENGDHAEIERKAVYQSADPILMPSMAVSAALQTELFSQVIWVLPIAPTAPMPAAKSIQNQLLSVGDITEQEASTLKTAGDQIRGRLRDTPWTISRINTLPEIDKPVVMHIDLSYFSHLYKNEIKTPLYSILAAVGNSIRNMRWSTTAVSVSTSNLSGEISLKTRFLSRDIVSLFATPELLEGEMPDLWHQRAQALYLDNLFQQEKVREIYLNLEKSYPTDAAVKYGLFDIFGQLKDGDLALQYLAEAVALDRIYALEYLDLADRARRKGRIHAAFNMLDKASNTFPDNPFITLKKVGLYRETGKIDQAAGLINNLQELAWSPVYDPDMTDYLKSLAREVEQSLEKPGH